MKKLLVILIACLIWLGPVLAFGAGGQEHGDKGQGSTVTGENGQGQSEQDRTGRN